MLLAGCKQQSNNQKIYKLEKENMNAKMIYKNKTNKSKCK